ncbi:3-hydroxybutyryl-CoA dehydrogenase [Weissella uvarum]|uniref:3-hydroxyacyl-CoA dehydrogenase n=1 Tax=Weissella uvarum TaxID=1479233 RepID=UPI0019614331|nr:3-hydroxyacyl-CoA dehydrogenase [Weissella uvarum]MBM7617233.1 3-hydroxybutyryl-CoA dehydrogenase [Weissella uvarum]MCM0595526.1 3-hydroxyacyl-CoA dehydrogenase [Weissella uvarum]
MALDNVVVAGGGTLGSQIAYQSAFKGKHVVLYDINEQALANAKKNVDKLDDRYREDMDATDDQIQATHERIKFTDDLDEALKGADIVVEAIPEDLSIKSDFYKKLAGHLDDDTILVSNTSTLLPSQIVEFTDRPDKFLALHFANEIWKRNLAELMPVTTTDKAVVQKVNDFAKEIGMKPIMLTKEQPGYVLNSLIDPWENAALRLWGRDVAEPADIDKDWMVAFGTNMGPFALMDMVGLELVHEIHSRQVAPGDVDLLHGLNKMQKLIDAGKVGQKSGQGFYSYPNPEFLNF